MSISKLCGLFQTSPTEAPESIEEKYALTRQLGSYTKIAQLVVGETAGTAGLNIANEQVKTFLTEFIPCIIINVTNIYGPKIGGKLLSEIQMILASTLTGGFGFDGILNAVIQVVGTSCAALLGFSEKMNAMNTMNTLLNVPIRSYASKLGYVNYIPRAVNWCINNQEVSTITNTVSTITNIPLTMCKETRAIYLAPFHLLSRWVADQTVQIIVSEARDPYINKTLIPAFEQFVDELLPKRDLTSNFDPLMTKEEHTLDVANNAINLRREQHKRFKRDNILIYLLLSFAKEVLKNPDVQDYLAESIGGERGVKMLHQAREVYEVVDNTVNEAYKFANDKHALSKLIAEWMQHNFATLASYGNQANLTFVQEHAGLFKHAFCGNILTKSELDTIKGKWLITQAVEEGISIGYHFAMKSVSELSSLESSRQAYTLQIESVKHAIEHGDDAALERLLKSYDENERAVYRYIVLKNNRLNFKSTNSLPITPLMRAIEAGNLNLVQLLVESCQTKNFKNTESEFIKIELDEYASGVTALHFAIMKSQNNIAKYLIRQGADLAITTLIGDATPLMLAAKYGLLDVTMCLLSYPQVTEHIDFRGYRDRTALHYAIQNKNMKVAAKLIECGADLFLEDASGVTPIGLLYQQLKQERAIYQLEKLLHELQATIASKVKTLIENKAPYSMFRDYLYLAINLDCNLSLTDGSNPLFHILFEHNEIKLIIKLMKSLTNSKLIEDAMWFAVNERQEKSVPVLLRSMKKVNANAITVKLMEFSSIEIINVCLNAFLLTDSLSQVIIDHLIHRNDFSHLDSKILLAIFIHQIANGQLESVQNILKRVPKVLDMQDALLNTPLHHSLKSGHYEITTFLLKQGADITLKNKENETAYESWSKNNTFLKQVLKKITGIFSQEEYLKEVVAINLHEINKQMLAFEDELAKVLEKEKHQKLYESLSKLISQDNKDEVRNEVMNKILQNAYCDAGLFKIHKGSINSLIAQAILKKDDRLVQVFIHTLLEKNPYQREDICLLFIHELLSLNIAETELLKSLKVILALPDNENNALLLLTDRNLRLPSEIAFQNKKYQLMEHILKLSPKGVTLAMMDFILSKGVLYTELSEQSFDINQNLIAEHLQHETVENTIFYLQRIWNRPHNSFTLKLFKTYFLNASGIAIDEFLKKQKVISYFKEYPITMEQFVSKFDEEALVLFINQQFPCLSNNRRLELLQFMISKGNLDDIILDIISANPTLLNVQLPELQNNTLLHMAIHKENWVLASYLMVMGGLVNLKNSNHNTAYNDWIRVTSFSGLNNAKIEETLLCGSDLEIRKALHRKIANSLIVKLFHAQEMTTVLKTCATLEEKIKVIAERVQLLLTAPHVSALNGLTLEEYHQIASDLTTELTLEHGITLNAIFSYPFPKCNGNTLLHQVITTHNTAAINFILKYPVCLDSQNDMGNTPLHLTLKNVDFNVSKKLIELGASFHIENKEMKTAKQLIESLCEQNGDGYSLFRAASFTKEQLADLKQLITSPKAIEAKDASIYIIAESAALHAVAESTIEVDETFNRILI